MVAGIEHTVRELNAQVGKLQNRTIGGLLAAGLIVQESAQRNVPVEYGNLHGSAYTQRAPDDRLVVEVGFSAAYALFVHENMEQRLKGRPRPSGLGRYWGPNGGPKFLTRAVNDNLSRILQVIARAAEPRR